MKCPYCKKKAKFVSNEIVYGKKYGKSHMIWYCKDCDAYVGVHDNKANRPKGTMAKKSLRIMRIRAHNAFDKIWKSGIMDRGEAYKFLAKELGYREVHIGECNEYACLKIIGIANRFLEGEVDNG